MVQRKRKALLDQISHAEASCKAAYEMLLTQDDDDERLALDLLRDVKSSLEIVLAFNLMTSRPPYSGH